MSKLVDPTSLNSLKQAVGASNISDDVALRNLFSEDIYTRGSQAGLVISPETTEQLSEAVRIASRENMRLNPRGGGMSYTKGYTPELPDTTMLDLSRMNKVLEVNEKDMYVTVQAGCTWKTLYETLKPLGVRTPFWGPLSGISSTIGGGLSNSNAFFGASTYGPSPDSVTSLTVVLADGTVVRTGSAASTKAKPFFRQYGPDLTGLFLCDSGSLGYKAEATFRLIKTPECEDWASFEFKDRNAWAKVTEEMGRLGLACELFGFDPNLQAVRMKRAGIASDVKTLANVVTGQKGGLLKGIKEGAKIALAGRSYMDNVAYSIHLVVEGHSKAEVDAKITTLKQIALSHNATEIENSIPKIIRANPFTPLNNMLGPQGERWVPIHGIVAMSDGVDCLAEVDALFETMKPEFEAKEITVGYLLTTLSTNGYLIEPVFIWPEEIFGIHEASVESSVLKRIKRFEPNPDASAVVEKARQSILDIFERYGAAHFQIGRTYRYQENMSDETKALLTGIKSLLDPKNLVNAGALGFSKPEA